ncbi:hypothetical protein HS088_TW04G00713 [Tripterygium wilfordii]|uniref:Uncharacterized protein n=1 Tax=Tripterygium wilfordii TaxID=458696 RepID=A0A7J7DQY4_TRIWF|nr:hypothetical protein HS088_TW04G00713 [Tripterygium wilfordii]
MAHLSNCSVVFFMVLALVLLSIAAVTAQDSATPPSPAMDAGPGSPREWQCSLDKLSRWQAFKLATLSGFLSHWVGGVMAFLTLHEMRPLVFAYAGQKQSVKVVFLGMAFMSARGFKSFIYWADFTVSFITPSLANGHCLIG